MTRVLPLLSWLTAVLACGGGPGPGHGPWPAQAFDGAPTDDAGASRWSRQLGSDGAEDVGAIAVGADGSLYVTGSTEGDLAGHANPGKRSVYLTKYTADGAHLWTKTLGTKRPDAGRGVVVGGDGAVYVAGYTMFELDGNAMHGAADIFVTKFTSDGRRQWTQQLGTPDNDLVRDLAIDGEGHLYVVGETRGDLGGTGRRGGSDAFLMRLDPDGTPEWTRQFGSERGDHATSVAVDGDDHVYVTGFTRGAIGSVYHGGWDLFVTRFETDGEQTWLRQLGTVGDDRGFGVAVDDANDVYVTGGTTGSLEGAESLGGEDAFLVKLQPDGTTLWAQQTGTAEHDRGLDVAAHGDRVFTTGRTSRPVRSAGSGGGIDAFVTEHGEEGPIGWTRRFGTAVDDVARAITVTASGDVFTAGTTTGDMGSGPAGGEDLFLRHVCG